MNRNRTFYVQSSVHIKMSSYLPLKIYLRLFVERELAVHRQCSFHFFSSTDINWKMSHNKIWILTRLAVHREHHLFFFSLPTRPLLSPPQGFSVPQKNAIKCSVERILLNRRINSQLLLCSSASAHSNELDYRSGSILLSIGFLGLKSIWKSRGRGKRSF